METALLNNLDEKHRKLADVVQLELDENLIQVMAINHFSGDYETYTQKYNCSVEGLQEVCKAVYLAAGTKGAITSDMPWNDIMAKYISVILVIPNGRELIKEDSLKVSEMVKGKFPVLSEWIKDLTVMRNESYAKARAEDDDLSSSEPWINMLNFNASGAAE